jgi:hypothetical protein
MDREIYQKNYIVDLMIFAGTPATITLEGNDLVTTALAATTTLSPNSTPAVITTPFANQQFLPIFTDALV